MGKPRGLIPYGQQHEETELEKENRDRAKAGLPPASERDRAYAERLRRRLLGVSDDKKPRSSGMVGSPPPEKSTLEIAKRMLGDWDQE